MPSILRASTRKHSDAQPECRRPELADRLSPILTLTAERLLRKLELLWAEIELTSHW